MGYLGAPDLLGEVVEVGHPEDEEDEEHDDEEDGELDLLDLLLVGEVLGEVCLDDVVEVVDSGADVLEEELEFGERVGVDGVDEDWRVEWDGVTLV